MSTSQTCGGEAPPPAGASGIDALLFSVDPARAAAAVRAGAAGVVVDWERRGKRERQAGADTQVNADTPADLAGVRAATPGPVVCRVNGWGPWSQAEIDLAARLGADELLLPMVRRPAEVDAALAAVAGRCGLGILVETAEAVRNVDELARRPLSRLYVGLNDLMIDRGDTTLFTALVDGTVDRVRSATPAGIPFGVAGLTVPEGGAPVPCRLVAAELARLDASFTFLRRSFHADTAGRDIAVELPRVVGSVAAARQRQPAQQVADRAELVDLVGGLLHAASGRSPVGRPARSLVTTAPRSGPRAGAVGVPS